MFDAECVILLKCLIAQSGSHLEDAVAHVTEAQCVLKIAQLQKQIWLCEALRLQEAILWLEQDAVSVLQVDVDVDLSLGAHLWLIFKITNSN